MTNLKQKKITLKKIAKEIAVCKICKKDSIGLPVPGEGNANAKIIFIGEAPGKTEAKTGRPFVGRSGNFLRANIRKIGLDDLKDVYIMSPVKYLPKQGTPTPQQITHGMTHTQKQLDIISPKVIVLMGTVASLGVLGEPIAVSKLHGQTIRKSNKTYFISYHPAAAVRFNKFRKVFEDDFKKLLKLL